MLGIEKLTQQDITVCPLCDEQYTDPRSLPCLHTFCLQCLDKYHLSFTDSTANCPICGVRYAGPPANLRRNFFVEKLIKINQIADVTISKQTPCNVCQQDDLSEYSSDPSSVVMATHYCINCAESLCGKFSVRSWQGSWGHRSPGQYARAGIGSAKS